MTKAETTGLQLDTLAPGKLTLKGHAVFASVPMFEKSGLSYEQGSQGIKALEISLSQVEKVDSAGLALLIEWLVRAKRENIRLSYTDIPAQLQAMAELCNVYELIRPKSLSD